VLAVKSLAGSRLRLSRHHLVTLVLAVVWSGCGGDYVSEGVQPLSERAVVVYASDVGKKDTTHLVYAVVLKGRPGWYLAGSSSSGASESFSGYLIRSTTTYTAGPARVQIIYSRLRGTLTVGGHTFKVGEANVILVDSVDTAGDRPPIRPAGRSDFPVARTDLIGPILLQHNAMARAFVAGA
jgi:hypothetical protein